MLQNGNFVPSSEAEMDCFWHDAVEDADSGLYSEHNILNSLTFPLPYYSRMSLHVSEYYLTAHRHILGYLVSYSNVKDS